MAKTLIEKKSALYSISSRVKMPGADLDNSMDSKAMTSVHGIFQWALYTVKDRRSNVNTIPRR